MSGNGMKIKGLVQKRVDLAKMSHQVLGLCLWGQLAPEGSRVMLTAVWSDGASPSPVRQKDLQLLARRPFQSGLNPSGRAPAPCYPVPTLPRPPEPLLAPTFTSASATPAANTSTCPVALPTHPKLLFSRGDFSLLRADFNLKLSLFLPVGSGSF